MAPEQQARLSIDALLQQAGWHVCDMANANIHASRGVALREFPLNPGYGFADYLLYIDGKAAGVIEAKKEGATLTGVEVQSARTPRACPHRYPPGAGPCLSATSPPGLRPISPRAWTPSRAPVPCLPFIGPRHWRLSSKGCLRPASSTRVPATRRSPRRLVLPAPPSWPGCNPCRP